jgi:hypothetical protein
MKKSRGCGSRRRGKRGGAMAPLDSGAYPGSTSGAGQWSTSVGGNPTAQAAASSTSFLGKIAMESGGAGVNPALAREMVASYAMKGPGQTGGGSRRRKQVKRRGSRRMRMSQAQGQSQGQAQGQSQAQAQGQSQAQAQGQSQSGGMFATFGALLKEALVPLGLLAAQQTYGKSYDKKRGTRKSRK